MKQLAEKKDNAEAMFQQGLVELYGVSGDPNVKKASNFESAMRWLRLAAFRKHAGANYEVSTVLARYPNMVKPLSPYEQEDCMRAAYNGGDPLAKACVEHLFNEAKRLAAQGNPDAKWHLFLALNEGDEVILTLTDAQVLYVYSGDIYLRDASGSLLLSGTGLNVNRNNVLNGTILGKRAYSNLMPQLIALGSESSSENLSVSSGEAALPIELFGWDLTADRYSDMVLVKGLTLVRDGGIYAVIGDRRMRLWNKFQIKSPKISLPSNIDGKFYDVTAIFGTDILNGEVIDELYMLSSPVEGEDPDAVEAVLAEDSSSSAVYNLYGQKVGKHFRGITVKNGKKQIQK